MPGCRSERRRRSGVGRSTVSSFRSGRAQGAKATSARLDLSSCLRIRLTRDDRWMLRGVLVAIGGVVLVVSLVTGLLWGFQRKLIYFPDAGPVAKAAEVL